MPHLICYRKLIVRISKAWTVSSIALVLSLAGLLVTSACICANQAKAESDRVFELRVYHAVPGRLTALESRFRSTASKLLAKHDLNVIGYWVSDGAPASDEMFIYVIAHPSRQEAKKRWDELRADPQFQEMAKSEQTEKLVERVDVTYMRPTDFSPMGK